jgi:hypothetical protein
VVQYPDLDDEHFWPQVDKTIREIFEEGVDFATE